MNISKLLSIGSSLKNTMRSFRLRDTAVEALSNLSDITGLSQNEIVNITAESLKMEYDLLSYIKQKLENSLMGTTVRIYKNTVYGVRFEIAIFRYTSENPHDKFKYVMDLTISGAKVTESRYFLYSLDDLFDFGVDSNYMIVPDQYNPNVLK